jgi:hypothetical protein
MTRKSEPPRADGDNAVGKCIAKTIDLVSRADPLERESIISGLTILGFWKEFCRERESDLEGLYKSEIEELFNRYPPWCEHVSWAQDEWCRDKPERLHSALWHVSMLSHVVVGGHSVIRLPPCAEYDPMHPPDDFRDLRNHLLHWAQITGGVIFARPNDETAPLQRFSESILIKARLTAPMVSSDMFEVLRPERGDSSSLFLYDVYVVAASAADRFDCQTGTIKPIAPAAMLDGEGNKSTVGRPAKFAWDGIVDQLLVRLVKDGDFETQADFICWVQSLDPDHSPDEKTIRDHFKRYVRFMKHVKKI